MKKSDWKDIAELIGIAAIVASLLFVGLQMKQSQEIAIAAQYHDRAALAVEYMHAQLESGNVEVWALYSGLKITSDFSAEDAGIAFLSIRAYFFMADNHLFQYESGFMDESAWRPQRALLKEQLTNDFSESFKKVFRKVAPTLRESFVQLVNQLEEEIEAETEGQ